jgi:plastocyanin
MLSPRMRGFTFIAMVPMLLGAALLASAGHVTRASAADAAGAVSIKDLSFQPRDLTIAAGGTVSWSNDEASTTHTVTSDDGSFDSGLLMSGQAFAWEFDAPGVYAYYCAIHPDMTGTITVV